ncbi:MAG: hypothetical protein HQK52_08065 [Oligoflexia bacterium]|nr:hypothetical protein [Oligoflexia bacterium]
MTTACIDLDKFMNKIKNCERFPFAYKVFERTATKEGYCGFIRGIAKHKHFHELTGEDVQLIFCGLIMLATYYSLENFEDKTRGKDNVLYLHGRIIDVFPRKTLSCLIEVFVNEIHIAINSYRNDDTKLEELAMYLLPLSPNWITNDAINNFITKEKSKLNKKSGDERDGEVKKFNKFFKSNRLLKNNYNNGLKARIGGFALSAVLYDIWGYQNNVDGKDELDFITITGDSFEEKLPKIKWEKLAQRLAPLYLFLTEYNLKKTYLRFPQTKEFLEVEVNNAVARNSFKGMDLKSFLSYVYRTIPDWVSIDMEPEPSQFNHSSRTGKCVKSR